MEEMNTFLIIGASGCIGFETAKWLSRNRKNDKVITLSRGKTVYPGELEGCIQEYGDISDRESIEKVLTKHSVSHVIHCAALRTSECNENPQRAREINVGGTQNVIEACNNSGSVKDFLFLSTAAVYDQVEEQQENVNEEAAVSKYAPYVATKLESEEFLYEFSKTADIAISVIRPQILFGPTRSLSGSTAGVTKCIQHAAFNKEYTIPYSGQYSFHYTGDTGLLLGTILCAEKAYKFEIFNLPGNPHKVNDFKDLLNNLTSPDEFISIIEKQYPFAKSVSFQKYRNYFGEVSLSTLEDAVKETFEHFKSNRF